MPLNNSKHVIAPQSLPLQQRLTGLEHEVELASLPIRGSLPLWLQGTLIRNGPAKFEFGGKHVRHWFDGLAMLHRFSFDAGQVSYINRFLQSPDYTYAKKHHKLGYVMFASDPCRSLFKRFSTLFLMKMTRNTNVSVSQIADHFVAWTETPLPIEFDPQTLQTVGVFDFKDHLHIHASTPHPLTDPCSGEIFNHSIFFSLQHRYKLYRIAAGSRRRELITSWPIREPAYMHSFALTPSYIVLTENPFFMNPFAYLLHGKPFIDNLTWKPEQGTRFLIFDRTSGHFVSHAFCPAFFCFHHINAFESGNTIMIDLLAHPDVALIDTFAFDELSSSEKGLECILAGELRRYTLALDSTVAHYELMTDVKMEMPTINEQWRMNPQYRYVYSLALLPPSDRSKSSYALVKTDLTQMHSSLWHEESCHPGEPIFAPHPDGKTEDDGVILSIVFHAQTGLSFLLVLDAQSFQEIARAEMPFALPSDLHGQYFNKTISKGETDE